MGQRNRTGKRQKRKKKINKKKVDGPTNFRVEDDESQDTSHTPKAINHKSSIDTLDSEDGHDKYNTSPPSNQEEGDSLNIPLEDMRIEHEPMNLMRRGSLEDPEKLQKVNAISIKQNRRKPIKRTIVDY